MAGIARDMDATRKKSWRLNGSRSKTVSATGPVTPIAESTSSPQWTVPFDRFCQVCETEAIRCASAWWNPVTGRPLIHHPDMHRRLAALRGNDDFAVNPWMSLAW